MNDTMRKHLSNLTPTQLEAVRQRIRARVHKLPESDEEKGKLIIQADEILDQAQSPILMDGPPPEYPMAQVVEEPPPEVVLESEAEAFDATLTDLPADLRAKVARLDPLQVEKVKDRVKARMRSTTAKKLAQIQQDQAAKEREIANMAPETELYDMQPQPGGWPAPARTIPKRIRFVPQAPGELVDIPTDLHEGIKTEIVEGYGVPPDEAGVIASNAVDRWIDHEAPAPDSTSDENAKMIEEVYQAAFSVDRVPGSEEE